jgi:DNA-binding GntR family transcriptional regulator
MSASAPLARVSTVDALAQALRNRILEGELSGGARLRENDLCAEYGVARHTVRSALRALAVEGLVRIEPNRGATVAVLGPQEMRALYELRTALEVEAARLALERHDGRLPEPVHGAVRQLSTLCARRKPAWAAILEAHDPIHTAIVEAAGSPRIAAAHAALAAEIRVFLIGIKPAWPPVRMAADHEALVADLEAHGPEALREHLRVSAEALGAIPAAGGSTPR